MTNAKQTTNRNSGKMSNLVPARNAGGAGRGHGTGVHGVSRAFRPAAPFLAHVIGERSAGNKLSRARRNLPAIFNAYGNAAQLSPRPQPHLDCTA